MSSELPEEETLRELMTRYQHGDLRAFEQLYAGLAPSLHKYLTFLSRNSEMAQDLVQDTFLQIHRSRRTYNSSRPLRPWAFAIARHVYQMDRRTRKRNAPDGSSMDTAWDIPVPPAAASFAREEELRRAIARLSPERYEALWLHHVWGFTFDEIAGMLGIRPGAARLRASRGMAELRQALQRT